MNTHYGPFASKIISWLAAAGLIMTSHAFAADPGKIVVQVDKPGAKISPMLDGLMTEEINYSYDGGLYGELIQNRSSRQPRARTRTGGHQRRADRSSGPSADPSLVLDQL
jgi:hypothetical protein